MVRCGGKRVGPQAGLDLFILDLGALCSDLIFNISTASQFAQEKHLWLPEMLTEPFGVKCNEHFPPTAPSFFLPKNGPLLAATQPQCTRCLFVILVLLRISSCQNNFREVFVYTRQEKEGSQDMKRLQLGC